MGAKPSKRAVRAVAALVAGLCVLMLVGSALATPSLPMDAAGPTGPAPPAVAPSDPSDGPAAEAPPDGPFDGPLTVVTTQGFYTGTHPGERTVAEIVAFDRAGNVVYHDSTYPVYFDVDPVPGTRYTVEYVAAERLGRDACPADQCSRNLVERVNLSTGEATRVYEAVTPQYQTGRWHDVDRLNETHLVVADIVYDRVFVVDVRTVEITWQWNASEYYPPEAGGPLNDWTHINDVEVLPDGRFMASMRNMDEVVVIDPASGVVDEWTLGTDDDHSVLFEQHNPDYIPAERGGPAVIVADSENNQVVEYHRADGEWTRVWSWRDPRLQWPRDADRLPDGHTLIVDSHGDRVLEVDTNGTVVWTVDIGRPYDVERLGTDGGSTNGYAAGSIPANDGSGGAPPTTDQGSADGHLIVAVKDALPSVLVNGLLFVAPPWVRFTDLLVAGVLFLDVVCWAGLEWRWSERSVWRMVRRVGARIS